MSRGAEHSTRQLTDQQLAQQNQLISQSNQQGTQDRSLLFPTIQSLLTSPGYTPAEQSAITQQSMGAANTAYDALRERAANRAAATNDTAAAPELTAQLGREQAQSLASQAQQNQIAFANQRTGSASRPQRPRSNLRHRHKSPRPRHGRPIAIARRSPARIRRLLDRRPKQPLRRRLQHRLAVWLAPSYIKRHRLRRRLR